MSEDEKNITLAQRVVRTQEGAEKYGKPVGSPIGEYDGADQGPGSGDKGPESMLRLMSLQRQYYSARKAGDKSRMRSIFDQFRAEAREYAKGKSLQEVMGPLDEAYAKMVAEDKKQQS